MFTHIRGCTRETVAQLLYYSFKISNYEKPDHEILQQEQSFKNTGTPYAG